MCECQDKEIHDVSDMCEDCIAAYLEWYNSRYQVEVVPVEETETSRTPGRGAPL
jgi:hypothetical protein